MQAINKGLQISGWLENLPADEVPPQEIWHHGAELDAWFERVKAERERKYSASPTGEQWEDVPGGETVEFDVARELHEARGY